MNILIVDDNPTNLKLLRAQLEAEGHEVVCAPDGVEALKVLGRQRVEAIISDLLMPRMDGYGFCKEVRQHERFCHLPFIVYTSTYTSAADEQLALDIGVDKYIRKPAPSGEIVRALAEVGRRQSQPQPGLPAHDELNLTKRCYDSLVNKLIQKCQELTEQTEAYRASEEKFRLMAENINEVLWIMSGDASTVFYISPSYEVVYGRTCKSLYDNPLSAIEAVYSGERAEASAALQSLCRGENFDLEYRITRPDGAIRWIRSRGTAIRDQTGAVYRVAGIAEDISRKKETEKQLRQAQKMESIGQLASGVAHDFNNILAVIGGNLELLLMTEENLSLDAKDYLSTIAQASDRAATLNRQLLTFSRSEAMEIQVVGLNDLVASFTKMIRRIVGENIKVQNDLLPTLPAIKGDPGMIEQVLMNLAVNARDAMPDGGQLTIATAVEEVEAVRAKGDSRVRPGLHICLSVQDTGTGIPPELLPRIFEPFFTTKAPGKGTGLGLATVFSIAEQHKGWVEVSSQVGAGTNIRVYLPIASENPTLRQAAAAAKPRGGTEKVILVEDDKALRGIILQSLENYGYGVVAADSGPSAQKLWSEHNGQFDLLLTDMVMPGGVTGLELAAVLRAQKPDLKVMLTSGYSADLAGAQNARGGNITFLHKPFSIRVLAETVRNCLDSKSPADSAPVSA
jgi:PAS domain S-box-containing protein